MKKRNNSLVWSVLILSIVWGCKVPNNTIKKTQRLPQSYMSQNDSTNINKVNWKSYFNDPYLAKLIDTALSNNQEMNIINQEILIGKNEVRARKGEYLPFVGLGMGVGAEKTAKFTRNGAVEENLDIDGKAFPEPLTDIQFGAYATWEVDVWKKLRNAKKAAYSRYLASVEGKNFFTTNLVSEIADSYYELLALDNMLKIVNQNAELQKNAFELVKQQKNAARVSQLAVNRFEAQYLNTKNLKYEIQQKIVERENKINFLVGRFYQHIDRPDIDFEKIDMANISEGLPTQLLNNRPDIRQAENLLQASNYDVKSAKARFYPKIDISAGLGLQAFDPTLIFKPESLLLNLAGDMVAPLINRNAIQANYNTATAKQNQAIYNYEMTVLKAYFDVYNQVNKVKNYNSSLELKSQQVDILNNSINISQSLYRYARADYTEVLLTQREALEAKLDLIEIKLKQLNAKVNIYRALGGGWH